MRRLFLAGALLAASTLLLAASTGGPYTLRKDDVSGGGGRAAGGSYALVATVGQADAAVQGGGSYRLTGGFHGPRGNGDLLFCDGFEAAPCP